VPSGHPTLAVVIARIAADETLTPQQRQDMTSALRTLAAALGRQPEELPAHPGDLSARLKGVSPAMAGVSTGRWRNVKSLVRQALKLTGLATVPGRSLVPLSPEWATLLSLLPNQRLRTGLSRLARFCSAAAIDPGQVDDGVMASFLDAMRNEGMINKPRSVHRTACVTWNRAAAIPGWPDRILTVPDYRKHYALPWSTFPASLKVEADAYFTRLAGGDGLEELDFSPLKPNSIATRKQQLHEFISALVHRGRDPATLRTLADVVAIDAVKDGLLFFIDRPEGKAMKHALDIASMLRALARHWVKVDEAQLSALKGICKRLNPGNRGLTDKNKMALRQFDDPANVYALVTLPQRLVKDAAKLKTPQARALQVQTALAIELLLMAAPRLENLVGIHLERHLNRWPKGNVVHLVIPGPEVKNGVPIEVALPASTVQLLDLYLKEHRPVLLKGQSDWLFPGRDGKAKSDQAIRANIVGAAKRLCGLTITPHQFRHINAKLYLDAHPGAYGVVRLTLGHKSVETTTQFYCGTETAAALRYHDEHILKLRKTPVAKAASAKRSAVA
jgi:integrase